MLKGKTILSILLFTLTLSSCNFRIELYEEQKETIQNTFDNSPPNVNILYPKDGSILSNTAIIVGQTEDNSQTITYILVGEYTNFYFTNQKNWIVEINTLDFTNGKLEIEVFAKDILNNTSPKIKLTLYISNSTILYVLPDKFLITNNHFDFYLTITTTNYNILQVYLNSSMILETNKVKEIIVSIHTNQEYFTNTLTCIVDGITNIRNFVFDYTPPSITMINHPISYIYGNYLLRILLDDFSESLLLLSNGNILNTFILSKGTNQIVVNTYEFPNGTNKIMLWAVDKAGNTSSKLEIDTIVANFTSTEYNRVKNKNYYQIDTEEFEGETLLFYTDNNFSYIFFGKENDNFKPNKTTSSYIGVSSTGKIRSIKTSNKVLLFYQRDDDSLIVRTNKDSSLTNFYQMFNYGNTLDFEILENNKLYLVRTTTNGILLVTDISNKSTNLITNLNRDSFVFSEKHQVYENPIFGIYNDQDVIIFTNSGILFQTNQSVIGGSIVSLSQNELHICIYTNNIANIYVFYDNTIFTNYAITNTNKILYIVGNRYNGSSIWGIVEEISNETLGIRILQTDKNSVIRNQFVDEVMYSGTYSGFKEITICSQDEFIKIIVISKEAETGSYYGKIVKFTGL